MKVLIASDTYPPNINGGSIATYHMATELGKRGHKVFVLAPSTSLKSYKHKADGVTIYRLRSIFVQKWQHFRLSPPILHSADVKRIVSELRPDIIHIVDPGFIPVSAMNIGIKLGIPVVGTVHLMPENLLTHYFRFPKNSVDFVSRLLWIQYARIYDKLDRIIAPTQAAANLLIRIKKKIANKMELISNGVDLKRFKKENNGEYLKKLFNLPDVPTMLFVGRLDKEKNLEVLLKALVLLKDKVEFHAIIAGVGREGARLHRFVKNHQLDSFITFTGSLSDEDLPNIYKTADIFVMPGTAELQSLVSMEAMATGLPVVGADAVALPHLVKDGQDGYLFRPGDAKDLANKLLKLLKDKNLREQMGQESLELIKIHDMSNIVPKIERIYEDVINKRKLSPKAVKDEGFIQDLKDLTDMGAKLFRD